MEQGGRGRGQARRRHLPLRRLLGRGGCEAERRLEQGRHQRRRRHRRRHRPQPRPQPRDEPDPRPRVGVPPPDVRLHRRRPRHHRRHRLPRLQERLHVPPHGAQPLGRDGRQPRPLDRQHVRRLRHRARLARALPLVGRLLRHAGPHPLAHVLHRARHPRPRGPLHRRCGRRHLVRRRDRQVGRVHVARRPAPRRPRRPHLLEPRTDAHAQHGPPHPDRPRVGRRVRRRRHLLGHAPVRYQQDQAPRAHGQDGRDPARPDPRVGRDDPLGDQPLHEHRPGHAPPAGWPPQVGHSPVEGERGNACSLLPVLEPRTKESQSL